MTDVAARGAPPGEAPAAARARALGWVPTALAFAFGYLYAFLSLSRFERFASKSWDLAIFEQAVRAYANFQAPIADLKGPGFNLLGDHFHPILAVLAPAYRLFPGPQTLLVAQAAALALSVVPVTRLAMHCLGRARGVMLGVAYGLSFGLQHAVDSDFHETAFAVPLLAFALEALVRGRWLAVVLYAAPLVLVKEDMGLTVAVVGLLLTRLDRRAGLALAAFGIVALVLTVAVIMPALNPDGSYAYWSKWAGGDGGLSIGGLLALPLQFFTPPIKLLTLSLLVGVTGVLGLRSPIFLVALPTLAWRLLSKESGYWGPEWHYSAVLMPIAFVALVDAIVRVRDSRWRPLRAYAKIVVPLVFVGSLGYATRLPLAAVADPATYAPNPRAPAAVRLLSMIPDGATVESDTGLMTRLTSRTRVFWFGDAEPVRPDYIVIDRHAGWSGPVEDPEWLAGVLHPSARYRVIFEEADYLLLARDRA